MYNKNSTHIQSSLPIAKQQNERIDIPHKLPQGAMYRVFLDKVPHLYCITKNEKCFSSVETYAEHILITRKWNEKFLMLQHCFYRSQTLGPAHSL